MARRAKGSELKPETRVGRPNSVRKAKTAAVAPTNRNRPTMNKMDMVREALRTLGNSARPSEIAAYIREHFDLSVANGMVSSYKSVLLNPIREADERPSMTAQERRFLRELIERVGAVQVQDVLNEMDGW